jgi:hypothetical protein
MEGMLCLLSTENAIGYLVVIFGEFFFFYLSDQLDVERMLSELFPASLFEVDSGEGGGELDKLVVGLSCDLIDDYPTADPRWAESSRYGQWLAVCNEVGICLGTEKRK